MTARYPMPTPNDVMADHKNRAAALGLRLTSTGHNDPDEPLDQTIWIARQHEWILLRHNAQFGANMDIERKSR